MIFNQVIILLLFGSVFILLAGLWVVIPIVYGLPWVPTQRKRIRRALELSKVRPGARVVTISADLKGWQPAAFDAEYLIFYVPDAGYTRKPGHFFGSAGYALI